MEEGWNLFVLFLIMFIPALVSLIKCRKRLNSSYQLPPGPKGWPVIGNLFDLGSMPHKTITELKPEYGPVVWLRLGSKNTIALLSAKAATEFFKNHDLIFADRCLNEVMKSRDFYKGSIALAPYGPYWRVMKRMMTVQMLVNKRINETEFIRRKCIDEMLVWIEKEAANKAADGGIHVARFVFLASFNMLGNLMLSRDLVDPHSTQGSKFFESMLKLMEWSGHPNIVDLFPWLKWLDPQGLRRRMDRDLGDALSIVSEFVKERKESGKKKKDFLEVLLEFEGNGIDEPVKISDHNLTLIITEAFLAGSETTSSTVEWAMVELLSNPETMIKVKAELNDVVGPGRSFEESHIENTKYLQCVIKETMRLHPPIPFLVPRKALKDTNFMSYDVPKDTQVFVNVWAIGRDSECWEESCTFKPERFMCSKVDYKGQHYELLPFGAGRRICAGIPLAHRMLHLVLGSLLHEFDWLVRDRVSSGIADTQERLGVTVRKSVPLKAIPKKFNRSM